MIGRIKEVKELNRLYEGNRSELVVIYGRRRVGKTYLVNETFKDRITFRHTGLSPIEIKNSGALKAQLEHFYLSLQMQGLRGEKKPKNWLEAFALLEKLLISKDDGRRQVVFIDELPWLDTQRSGFVTAFEAFYNGWCSAHNNIMVIVCGSASSWIQDKLLNNYGGLYNRVTYKMKLSPFTLKECEDYYISQNVSLSKYSIVQSYMVFGGIPYYLGYIRGDLSLAQNIDELFFADKPLLDGEYDRLFMSVFANPEKIKKIIEFLFTRNRGYTRKEISEGTDIPSGSDLTDYLEAIVASDFAIKYISFGAGKREECYRLTDPFCIFYLHFLNGKNRVGSYYWQNNLNSSAVNSWCGIAFENVCFNHIKQIKNALSIGGIETNHTVWTKTGGKDSSGTQIDLIIERADNVINLCELKFYSDEFTVDKKYEMQIRERVSLVNELISKKQTVRNTLITTFGLKKNEYSGIFTNVVTLEELFT
jgi:AAA+ ATPase superfamily predicted ATPase